MTYAEAVEYLYALPSHEQTGFEAAMAEVVSLQTMRALAALLGDPQLGLRVVHIAGSKGKGSVAAMTEAILRAAGLKTGLFTSPHLLSPRERIQIGGKPASEQLFADLVRLVRPAIEEIRGTGQFSPPTFFEATAAMAFLAFARERVDVAILETGLGGRLDATNIIEQPLACAITSICLEHTGILGDTVAEIAAEKAGIIKPGVPVVLAPDLPADAADVINQRAAEVGAPVVQAPAAEVERVEPIGPDDEPRPQVIRLADGRRFELALLGRHQAGNAAVAVALAGVLGERGLEVGEQAVAEGLRGVFWPGRLQVVAKRPRIVLDCAHAPFAAEALAAALREYFRYKRLLLVVGMNEDKDVAGFAAALAPLWPRVYLCQAELPRALAAEQLKARAAGLWDKAATFPSVSAALSAARADAGEGDLICVTGSVYVVAEAMAALPGG